MERMFNDRQLLERATDDRQNKTTVRNSTNLEIIEGVAQEHVAVALEKSIHTRCHHSSRTWLDAGQMETREARTRHSSVLVAFVICWDLNRDYKKAECRQHAAVYKLSDCLKV